MNQRWTGADWELINGDCCEELPLLRADSVDLSVFSPPFSSLYTYSASDRDIGNCKSQDEFLTHMSFMIAELLRVTKPGRLTCCHIAQLTSTKSTHGGPIWYGIDETDTLNAAVARENADERHICPLQLGTIERCVRLWSNPGELVSLPKPK